MKRLKILALGAFLLATLAAFHGPAQAQTGSLNYYRFGTNPVGTLVVAAYSDTAGVITDGTVVMTDTTAIVTGSTGTVLRFSIVPWDGGALNRWRILGLAYGDIPAKASGAAGKVLVMGYHNNAKMASSTLSANVRLKTAPGVTGALTTVADSLSGAFGTFIGYKSTSTAANARGKVLILRPMGFGFFTL